MENANKREIITEGNVKPPLLQAVDGNAKLIIMVMVSKVRDNYMSLRIQWDNLLECLLHI